jgi:hypothetical protein
VKRLLLIVATAVVANNAAAQTTKYGPLAFRLPASTRMLGVADIGVIGRDDDVLFYNPAQLMVARGTSASVERMNEHTVGGTMSTVLRLGPGAIGIGVNYLEYLAEYAVYPVTRADILRSPASYPSATSTLASIGYAQTYKGVRLGLSANYGADQIGFERYYTGAADVGAAKDFGRFTTALSLQHLAPAYGGVSAYGGSDAGPPMEATLGESWAGPAGPLDLVGVAAVTGLRGAHVSPAIGGEASWSWLSGFSVAWRAGVRYPTNVDDAKYTAGFGFTADRTTFDLAAEVLPNDKVGYRLGIRVR